MARELVPQKPNHTDKPTDKAPCQCCGKEVKSEWLYSVELDTGNYAIDINRPDRTLYREESIGFFPIGPNCAMWLMKEYREFFNKYVHVG